MLKIKWVIHGATSISDGVFYVIFAGSLTPGMEPLLHHMELQSLHTELQNLLMEHLRHHMDLQSLHMRPLFPPTKPQNPHTEHQSLLTEHQSLLITAHQYQHQSMLLHLPSTGVHPMERPQPQWWKLPMSGGDQQNNLDKSIGIEWRKCLLGPWSKNFPDWECVGIRERQTSRPPLMLTTGRMFLDQQGKEGLMNATVSLLPRCLNIPLFQSSLFPSNPFCSKPYLIFLQCPSNQIVGGVFKDYSALINPR